MQEYRRKYYNWELMRKSLYFLTLFALALGLILTIISFARLCSSQCAATHDYRIWGMHFETIGMIYFPLLFAAHALSWKSARFGLLTALLLAAGLGAELVFIGVQKFLIGSWCPVCLSIAATIALAAIYPIYNLLTKQSFAINPTPNEEKMNDSIQKILIGTVFAMGFLGSFIGIDKINPLDAVQESVKESITFGPEKSDIEIYLFTDWQCPACRKLENNLESFVPEIVDKYKLVYVDFPIHPETMNYTPYNLSFMMNNKTKYLKIRDALTELSEKTGTPTEAQVEASVAKYDVTYKPINFADVAVGMNYFKHLADEFKIDSTPTMVIVNRATKKGKKLYGAQEINQTNIQKAVDALK